MAHNSIYVAAIPTPPVRRLRVYAFDPQSSVELDTAVINDAIIELPWETRWEEPLEPGPRNDYLEVIDIDPSSDLYYAPIDLNHPMVLAQNGLPPSEGRPQFHQQMVFAVAMRTIRNFERALGRPVFWAGVKQAPNDSPEKRHTKRLRIYPHALLEPNAYYSPDKRALLFGYFKDIKAEGMESWVFTCLSQDIVAHETTHAILHGAQQRSIEASNPDMLAFHEAFADIIALLQHFGLKEVVRHQLGRSKGSLRHHGLLTGLALQFGHATGRKGALRYALELLSNEADASARATAPAAAPSKADPARQGKDGTDADGSGAGGAKDVENTPPKPTMLNTFEAHARGGFLVAAVFDAFVTIYEYRTADLFRIAGKDSGGDGSLPIELVERLAGEAAKAADHVLRMCVRALDYMPPVDVHFGEYLRAIITADSDLIPNDPMRYRVAFVEAFKKRGIGVPSCISLAPDSLVWDEPDYTALPGFDSAGESLEQKMTASLADLLQQLVVSFVFSAKTKRVLGLDLCADSFNLREMSMKAAEKNQQLIHDWLEEDTPYDEAWEVLLGMFLMGPSSRRSVPINDWRQSIWTGAITDGKLPEAPKVEVHSARIARRAGPDGQELKTLVIVLTQKRRGYDDPQDQIKADAGDMETLKRDCDFWFRGGATVHVDLRDGRVMRVIRKRFDNDDRLARQRSYRAGDLTVQAMGLRGPAEQEPFAFIHRSEE